MGKVKTILKLVVSLGFLWFAVTRVDFAALSKVLSQTNLALLAFSIALGLAATLIMVVRWEILLKIFFKDISLRVLVPVYWIGLFFNLFLPSAVGGDAVKIYKLAKKHGKTVEFTTTVLMDRIIGLVSITLLAVISIFLFKGDFDLKIAEGIILWLSVFLIFFFLVVFSMRVGKRFKFILPLLSFLRIERIVRNFYFSFNLYRSHPRELIKAILVSLASNVITCYCLYLVSVAVSANVSPIYFYVITPIIFIITVLPISISGLGLQDGAYIFFLGQIGVSPAVAFSISILSHFGRYLTGLIGGVIFLFERDRSPSN
ncbi:hypothetical protein A2276_03050 [candidate division WOR-1 bacterium RIFOXYA12_FULL_43_27]|uniref:TIGR00374 family protein n=1 Tax=candidate division WOR-1 bacterium RIFOXYC2_FULL_46_14 TaxID=1802587 RepID=A0A1F4U7U7_UNCSA|nr:MAG: hypothetical protein A2276_03050 [candidate division WOR-1 bacterium RIFOXYA12_FULL_43_27]OGC19320.1 MAG: hypothetical protein A2292_01285 [candidate division WOR-1 bacterium RIFOXYB2_FULL_46_45]OGC30309.1 MAG: hypothetical protein A2232_01285 [candidate division WOR-1 bacterium RIFOXYA2_FULL_46_56]OGC40910.1 MAG: hypothetical protein A2438_01285 [candidate division WOR-1 bacterium RIFOXYC2_FULL_46_14]